jgi:predicted DNA-binding transcriptional regulator AlpA
MTNKFKHNNTDEPVTISLAAGCRRFGITPHTAMKLMDDGEFPRAFKLGGKRLLPRRAFEDWMAQKLSVRAP